MLFDMFRLFLYFQPCLWAAAHCVHLNMLLQLMSMSLYICDSPQKGFLTHLFSPMCFPVGNILPSAASCDSSTYGLDTLSAALCITDCLCDDVGITSYTHHMILLNLIWEYVEWMYSICTFMCFTSTSSHVQTIHICVHVCSNALRKNMWPKKMRPEPIHCVILKSAAGFSKCLTWGGLNVCDPSVKGSKGMRNQN